MQFDRILQSAVTEDELRLVTKLANEVVEAQLPVYYANVSLDTAQKIPGVVFLPDEVTTTVVCLFVC